MWSVTSDPVRFDEALDWFRARVPLPRAEWDLLQERARRRAFTVSGVAQLELLEDVYSELLKAVEDGTDFRAFKEAVGEKLYSAWGGKKPSRLETVFRTQVQSAYAAGRYRQLTDPDVLKLRPYWMYDAVLDQRTSGLCRGLNGTIRPADDPFWDTHTPPLHFNALAAGTRITTWRGQVSIEEVEPGDLVLTHRRRWKPVYAVMGKRVDKPTIRRLQLATGRVLFVTEEHPILTLDGWQVAGKLEVGDMLFEHGEPVRGLADVATVNPEDFPAPLDEPPIAFEVGKIAVGGLMPFAVNLECNLVSGECKIQDVGLNNELKLVADAGGLQETHDDGFAGRRVSPKVGGQAATHPTPNTPVVRGVVDSHALGGCGGPSVALFLPTPSPMVSAARLQERVAVGDGGLGSFGADLDTVALTPGAECRLAEAERTLNSSDRFPSLPVAFANKPFDSVSVPQVQWRHAAIISIAETPASGTVWNLAVKDDETYLAEGVIVHNCRSGLRSLTRRQAEERGVTATLPDAPPADAPPAAGFGSRPDPEAWGRDWARGVAETLERKGRLETAFLGEPPGPADYGRPKEIPATPLPRPLLPTVEEVGEERFLELLAQDWGGLELSVQDPTGAGLILSEALLGRTLGRKDKRERFLGLLPELIREPFEIWLVPLRYPNGRVVFQKEYIRLFEDERGYPVLLVAEQLKGAWTGFNVIRKRDPKQLGKSRRGFLRYGK